MNEGFIKDTITVRDRKTGKEYDCIAEMIDLNFDGKYVLRYNIGINGYHEWTFIHAIYDNETFNNTYEVINK